MAIILDGTTGITTPAEAVAGNLSYTGTLTGSTGVVNIGSGQVYKDASGNVGFGTTSPRSVGGYTALGLNNTTGVLIDCFVGGTRSSTTSTTATDMTIGSITSMPLRFTTADTERARIDASGNLLVNQTALNGAGKVEISYDRAGSWGMQIRNTTGTTAATTFIEFKYVNSTVGYIGSSNGTSTQYNTSSDYRLKEDIAPITGALAKVVALKPVTYKWKSTGTLDEGFIAHELAEVCPSAVTGEKDAVDAEGKPQYQGIDTSFLVATLTAAIQELKAIVDTQAARITALEGAAA